MRIIKSFKLKVVFVWVLVALVLCGGVAIGASRKVDGEVYSYKIVLDAGHGGRDDGCSGVNGAKESEINLKITKKIANLLDDYGFKVYLTRKDENGLYDEDASNYKQSDMKKRINIIEKVKPDFVVSIHQNSYPDSKQKGAQAFYEKGDELGKIFAESMQSQLYAQLPNARKEANIGDYYILNETKVSAIIVECGYLSNQEEELMLLNDDYQTKVAYAVVCGVVKYFTQIK